MVNSVTRASAPVAVIDLGSNTILLLVLEPGGGVLRDEARITRLGQGVFATGVLDPDAKARTCSVVREFASLARELGAERVVGVGTEALRCARDGEHLLEELCAEGTLDAGHLLDGQQEAELAIAASRRAAVQVPLVVIDVGGGSTELAWTGGPDGVQGTSLPLGSVRLTEALVSRHPIPAAELAELRRAVEQAGAELSRVEGLDGGGEVVAVAGTATTLAAMELRLARYAAQVVEGLPLERQTLSRWIGELARMSVEQRRRLPGLEPGRADVIVAGLVILEGVLGAIGTERFRVSGRGVRFGVAFRLLEGRNPV